MLKIRSLLSSLLIIFVYSCSTFIQPKLNTDSTPNKHPLFPKQASTITPTPLPNQPNIILILTDDLDTGSLDYMPYVKKYIGDAGVSFENYLVNVSLCCPSRASTLLGQYAHNTHIKKNRPPEGGFETFISLNLEEYTIALSLQKAGYRTALIGKYLNGYPNTVDKTYIPIGWDEWYSPVDGTPYLSYKYVMNENGNLVPYGKHPKDYITDVLANKAMDFITRTIETDQPFFLYLATFAPHGPSIPAKRHDSLFKGLKQPRTTSFNEANVSDKPDYIQNLSRLTVEEKSRINRLYQKRLRSLQAVDELVFHIITQLEALGQLDNTYIFFTSDNGFHLGQHRLYPGKQTPYEEDIRVSLLVRGPDVNKDQTRYELVGNIDIAPTFAEIAGSKLLLPTDGRSFLNLLRDTSIPITWRKAFLVEHEVNTNDEDETSSKGYGLWLNITGLQGLLEPPDTLIYNELQANSLIIPPFFCIRTNRYKYVEYDTGEKELYDLQTDPLELENLIKTYDRSKLILFSNWLSMLKSCYADSCTTIDASIPSGLTP